jgi:streptomycin 3"-adenylyltransferase
VELTIVVEADVRPLADHPRMDFQYGEWLRDELDAGEYEPREPYNPDVLVLLAQVLARSRVLIGREATELIDAVPRDRLAAAMVAGIDGLLGDLLSDTANVLLTLARIWTTLETEEFVTKDEAADRAIARLPRPARPALVHARVVYVGEVEDEWNGKEVSATAAAEALAGAIRAHERV